MGHVLSLAACGSSWSCIWTNDWMSAFVQCVYCLLVLSLATSLRASALVVRLSDYLSCFSEQSPW